MVSKSDLSCYFFSLLLNFCFLFLLFSNLRFLSDKSEPLKVKVLSEMVNSESFSSHTALKSLEEIQFNQPEPLAKGVSFKREETLGRREVKEEKLLEERIAQIAKAKQKGLDLSKEEIGLLNRKLASLKQGGGAVEDKASLKGPKEKSEVGGSSLGQVGHGTKGGQSLSSEYLFLIKRKLQNHFEIPIYLKNQKDLTAMVKINIAPDGKILSYTFLKKSSVNDFNVAVERCLKSASPLPIDRPVQVVVEFRGEGVGKLQ